jgi:hypothetical protein
VSDPSDALRYLTNPHILVTVRCAVCRVMKGQTNHWYVARLTAGVLTIRQYTTVVTIEDADEPLCGHACTQKKLTEYLSGK